MELNFSIFFVCKSFFGGIFIEFSIFPVLRFPRMQSGLFFSFLFLQGKR